MRALQRPGCRRGWPRRSCRLSFLRLRAILLVTLLPPPLSSQRWWCAVLLLSRRTDEGGLLSTVFATFFSLLRAPYPSFCPCPSLTSQFGNVCKKTGDAGRPGDRRSFTGDQSSAALERSGSEFGWTPKHPRRQRCCEKEEPVRGLFLDGQCTQDERMERRSEGPFFFCLASPGTSERRP